MSIFKSVSSEGQKQKLSISNGETYTGFIDQLAKKIRLVFQSFLSFIGKFSFMTP
jgi:UPF0755 protein